MSLDIERWLRRPKIDVHCHVWNLGNEADEATSAERLISTGDMLGITEFWCSSPITGGRLAGIEEVRAENDAVLRAMKRFPDHIRGLCFVIPGHFRHALDEIDRCLDAGMIGLKLYNQYRIDDPAVVPVIERIVERKVPLLEHAGLPTSREFLDGQPLISNGRHFAEVNRRYPEAMVIHAHIGGGGDWEKHHSRDAWHVAQPGLRRQRQQSGRRAGRAGGGGDGRGPGAVRHRRHHVRQRGKGHRRHADG